MSNSHIFQLSSFLNNCCIKAHDKIVTSENPGEFSFVTNFLQIFLFSIAAVSIFPSVGSITRRMVWEVAFVCSVFIVVVLVVGWEGGKGGGGEEEEEEAKEEEELE